ncbi:MAG: hypothetical protein QF464_01600 [Myxococcota bacterium]|nr:hypothetical protein [Myxococcota bacterium]
MTRFSILWVAALALCVGCDAGDGGGDGNVTGDGNLIGTGADAGRSGSAGDSSTTTDPADVGGTKDDASGDRTGGDATATDTTTGPGPAPDAGVTTPDAALPAPDTGAPLDASPTMDVSPVPDTATSLDAGSPADASVVSTDASDVTAPDGGSSLDVTPADAEEPVVDTEADAVDECAPGSEQPCLCEDEVVGLQSCDEEALWGPCECEEADPCEACLASGGTWQPEANMCTEDCDLMDISCYTSSCPAPCSAESCGTCFGPEECGDAGCQWNAEPPAFWCN